MLVQCVQQSLMNPNQATISEVPTTEAQLQKEAFDGMAHLHAENCDKTKCARSVQRLVTSCVTLTCAVVFEACMKAKEENEEPTKKKP